MTTPTPDPSTLETQMEAMEPGGGSVGASMSSITDQDKKFVETWENVGPGTTGILRLDARGDVRHEMVRGQRSFYITTEERMISQERVLTKELDPFMNGTFRPVVVPDSVTVKTNPNALSDAEINKILKSSELAWSEWMNTIDSIATLRRMMEVAEGLDDFSLKRFREIESRLVEVRPLQRISTNDPALQEYLEETTKRGGLTGSNPNRRQGGRSSDYRPSPS